MMVDHSKVGNSSPPWVEKWSAVKVYVYWWRNEKTYLHRDDDSGM